MVVPGYEVAISIAAARSSQFLPTAFTIVCVESCSTGTAWAVCEVGAASTSCKHRKLLEQASAHAGKGGSLLVATAATPAGARKGVELLGESIELCDIGIRW